ncbi:Mitogen-activated protein kinase kinase 1 interacting family protein [Cryptosporidium meleagridis]|uniref:Mitogen-activated protein kinase kinase 1 interacting family protein n=1 Tax=Cryptosporidium meleagridis TaxID=93969 RepID=A0A2P4Z262_9CRYT|nr:Mitogen-activated protein kinase kinase 1 interacting family protein [Cryptosporidium meleagridis]
MDSSSIGISDIITSSEDSYEDFSFSFEQLITLINSMIERKKGLESICVTDRDGVVVLKASNSSSGSKSLLANPSIPVVFASLISSCEKLEEFGKASFAIIRTNKDSTFQINFYPLIINIVTNSQYEGEVLELIPQLKQLLFGVRRIATSIINS